MEHPQIVLRVQGQVARGSPSAEKAPKRGKYWQNHALHYGEQVSCHFQELPILLAEVKNVNSPVQSCVISVLQAVKTTGEVFKIIWFKNVHSPVDA